MLFAERLKKLRDERGYTQGDLAKHLGVSQPTIVEYETGKKMPRPDKLIKLAQLLGTSVDYLLGETDEKEPMDEIKKEIESSTPDLLEILKRTRPHVNGIPIGEAEAKIIKDILIGYLKREGQWPDDDDNGEDLKSESL